MKKLVEFLVNLPAQPRLYFRAWREKRFLKELIDLRFEGVLSRKDRKKIQEIYTLRNFVNDLKRSL